MSPFDGFMWNTDEKSNHVLQGEENHHEVVCEVNDVGEPVVLNSSVLVLLQLLCCGDDKGDSGDQENKERRYLE